MELEHPSGSNWSLPKNLGLKTKIYHKHIPKNLLYAQETVPKEERTPPWAAWQQSWNKDAASWGDNGDNIHVQTQALTHLFNV